MTKLLRAVVLLALVAASLAVAGCGGDVEKNNDYVDAVNKAQNEFASTFDRLNARITATSSPKEDRATLKRFQDAIDKVVGDLRAVDPPSKVTDLHKELIGEINSYGGGGGKAPQGPRSPAPAQG